jgi:rod shape-determining protein MreC
MSRPRRAGLVLTLLLLAAGALIALDLHEDGGAPLRRAGQAVAGPVEDLVANLTAPFTAAADRRVQELERQNTRLQAQLWAVNADRELAAAGRNLGASGAASVRVPHPEGGRLVTARVVALGSRPGHAATATIDVGRRDGVGPDLTVLNTDGLVGRVLDAGPHTATVLLAADPTSQIGVRLAGSGEIGVLTGGGRDAPFRLELLDGDAPVKAGQTVETLGSDRTRPYVSDVPVGTVASAGPPGSGVTRSALVRPAVHFTSLGVVGVVLPPKDSS